MTIYNLMIAVNDDRNGAHTGRVDMVHLYTPDNIDLLALEGRPIRCYTAYGNGKRVRSRILHIGHLHCRIVGYATWVGNWCWDQAQISVEDILKVINYLRRRGWTCYEGAVSLVEKYDAGQDIIAVDLELTADDDGA